MNQIKYKKSSILEKCIYGIGNVGANFCWTFMAMYITMYYTDSIGISAAVAGTVMLVARLFDGISDVIMAVVIEKCHMKLGKIRPWFLISAPLLAFSLFLCFHVPQTLSVSEKEIYVFITYTFTAAVAYTIYNLAYSSILPLMSLDSADRNKASAVGNFINMAGMMVLNVATPVLLGIWGGEKSQGAWGKIATIYAILCGVLIFSMGLFIKEKETDMDADIKSPHRESIAEMLKIVLSTRYTWILMGMFVLYYIFNNLMGIRIYFCRDVLGDFNVYGVGATIYMALSMTGMVVMPVFFEKLGKKRTIITGCIVYIIGCVVLFAVPNSAVLYFADLGVMGFASAPLTTIMYIYIADLVDFVSRKHNFRAEGIISMASSIGTKVGSGLGSAAIGWGLAFVNYDGMAQVQSGITQTGIVVLTTIAPIALLILLIVGIFLWNIDNRTD